MAEFPFEPFRIKVVEPLRLTTREERRRILDVAGFNSFLIRAEDILIDRIPFFLDAARSARNTAPRVEC